ncbi:MAG: hypothetical protein A3J80_13215 [Desulfobacula sp. RIFOXYB2_FULL_45_6]|nr:MAG: hypothetical protein A3J80_13215 [Desulfobacula sp. RIFOXYB2_FULL_45_6]
MKKIVLTVSVLYLFLVFVPAVFCADTAKIGLFDFQKVLSESSAGKSTQKQLTDKGNDLQSKLKTEKEKLDEMNKAYEREKLVLSPEKQAEKEKEFRNHVNEFKKMQDDFTREFKQLEIQSLNKIQEEVVQIINEIGKAEGYTLILEKKAGGVLYYTEKLDVTDQVIKKYNSKAAKTN